MSTYQEREPLPPKIWDWPTKKIDELLNSGEKGHEEVDESIKKPPGHYPEERQQIIIKGYDSQGRNHEITCMCTAVKKGVQGHAEAPWGDPTMPVDVYTIVITNDKIVD